MPHTFVIVGAGQAGVQAACTMREHGFQGRVVIIGDEPLPPYQRPPLSKKFLEQLVSVERLYLRPPSYYSERNIDLRLRAYVESIDRAAGRIHLRGGTRIPYDRLLLCTGSRPRVLKLPGADSPDVHYLRTMQDALRLRGKLLANRRVVIIGGGYIGLEVAATASNAGAKVTVLESAGRILNRVTTDRMSHFFARLHGMRGVEIRCNERVIGFECDERLRAVQCESGAIAANVAVVGIGAVPNVELAQWAGLPCEDGVIVDEHCRTEDAVIYAAGDCTKHPNLLAKRRLRLESVQNATDQARVAALNMCGQPTVYREVPWFWSQQYEYKLQAAGIFEGHDEIEERGSIQDGKFALLYRKSGALLGVDTVNMPREYMAARKAIADQAFAMHGVASNVPAAASTSP